MKLSKLYSNKPGIFEPVRFVAGLNVVLAEIRLPENREKDTHNLGKTTLVRLLDYAFLAGRDPDFFLFKHFELFKEFVFFLEIELPDASYVTVRRGVGDASKISFKKHVSNDQDFSTLALSDTNWDHVEVPFERARELLDGLLDWRSLKPWSYRKGLGYLLRTQADFSDVFQLSKFSGVHSDWKPFLSHLLGFDGALIASHYEKEEELTQKQEKANTIMGELGGSVSDLSKIEGLLQLKQKEAEKKQNLLDAFDFRAPDRQQTKQLVDIIDEEIADLNAKRYSLANTKKKIQTALEEDEILFDPEEAKRLFDEVGVHFKDDLKKDYIELVAFNRAITSERRKYLEEENSEVTRQLEGITTELNVLGKRRSQQLAYLSNTDAFLKYKQVTNDMVTLRADITSLERQRGLLRRLQDLRTELRSLKDECSRLQVKIENDVEQKNFDKNSKFSKIRFFFSEFIAEVIDRTALLSVGPNQLGHLEFKAEILDESGKATSADAGFTYRKLLCMAFDMAILRAHVGEGFPRFVYHDGALEALDNRKKENLIAIIKSYAAEGIQPIITLIDSDLPKRTDLSSPVFSKDEIVLTLHDEGDQGRLFKIPSW